MARFNENPFPGMNPWLEAHWGDVHTRLTTYACDHLQRQLPPGLRARIEEYVVLEPIDDGPARKRPRFAPDIRILARPDAPAGFAFETEDSAAVALLEPPILVPRYDELTLHTIQILDLESGHRIVTSIEFLSPANKSGRGRTQFRDKQDKLIAAGANVVEIDLVREGIWSLSAPESECVVSRGAAYHVCIVRAANSSQAEIYPLPLDRPLPTLPIPLRSDDADVRLPLQPLLNQAFVNGYYADDLDYTRPPKPALSTKEAAWAKKWLKGIAVAPGKVAPGKKARK